MKLTAKILAEDFNIKKSRFTDAQIVNILKQAEQGVPFSDILREHNISQSTFYKWRSKYAGMDASLITRLKELKAENARFKKCMLKSV